jgi:hypothetical protein
MSQHQNLVQAITEVTAAVVALDQRWTERYQELGEQLWGLHVDVVEAARLAARAAWGREIAEFDALIDALAAYDEIARP